MNKILPGLIAGLLAMGVSAGIELPKFFSSHMVLQRDAEIPIYGKATPASSVEVAFAGQHHKVVVNADGRWEVKLTPLAPTTEGRDLTIWSSDGKIVLSDVVVGDVWMCSGQSNMEYSFGWHPLEEERFAAEADGLPQIRTIRVVRGTAPFPDADLAYHPIFLAERKGWHPTTRQHECFDMVTCVGWFFARRLVRETGLAIGLINTSWSASRIEPFIPPSAFATEPSLGNLADKVAACLPHTVAGRTAVEAYVQQMEQWRSEVAAALKDGKAPEQTEAPRLNRLDTLRLGSTYNRMVHPFTRLPIKGVIWYQGCANAKEGESYLPLYRALVNGWRQAWGRDLPFYAVQLAAFWNNWRKVDAVEGGDGFTLVREAQRKGLSIPNTGLAVAIDLGEPWEIHPREKYHVGERLALWALRNEYGKDVIPSGPIYRDFEVKGAEVWISFDYAECGLMTGVKRVTDVADPVEAPKGTVLKGFAIAGADRKWHHATARIEGSRVVVSAPEVSRPAAVRYAFRGAPECNLYNRAGLPASPFRTDDWPCPLALQ
ncbi:MAG: sialate O-acetylesterase [Kiritimatiellia bacterium]|nr:sialate O-acetylesterase [Kiritimatiellia bacterium]